MLRQFFWLQCNLLRCRCNNEVISITDEIYLVGVFEPQIHFSAILSGG